MKEKLINNLGIKILSICLAAFFWVVIVNVEDPVKMRSFSNVPVQVINESTLTSKNKAFDIISGDMVDFTVSGKRSDLEKLKKTDFVATADLSQLTAPFDTIKINVECIESQDVEIIMGKISTMQISLEDIVKESYSIKVDPVGNCAPGYAVGKAEVSPVILEVSGAKSIINKIADVKVSVDINGASSDVTRTVMPKAYNQDGIEITSDKIKFSNNEVTAKITILNTKKVPVVIETTGELPHGYQFIDAAFEPQEIEVKGDKDKLDNMVNLPVTVNIGGLTEDKEYTISIHEQLQQYGVSVVDSELENIVIKVTIEKISEKTLLINKSDIEITNLAEGLHAEIMDENPTYVVTFTGLEDELENFTAEMLSPKLDLTGVEKGRHRIELSLSYPVGLNLKAAVKVKVRVTELEDESPETSERPDSDTSGDTALKPSVEPSIIPSPSIKPTPEGPDENEEENEIEE